MTADPRLRRLQEVAGLIADRALAPVADAAAQMRRIEARIEALAEHRAKLLRATEDPALAGPMLAQAERLRGLQAAALGELAQARVALEAARSAAAKAVGRDHALKKLAERKAAEAQRDRRRRPIG